MAEQVQASMDQMVAPLADLQDRGIFSESEIAAIVARRRQSEYLMRRRNPRKADFLEYIKQEQLLEKLCELRTKRKKRELKEEEYQRRRKLGLPEESNAENKNISKNIGDKHVLSHLHLLWIRTLRKYKSDLSLFLEYADFCKRHRSWRQLSKCYAECLQYHPHAVEVWIDAASHEYFVNRSVQNARVLLQRGIRINTDGANKKSRSPARDLWLQLFALELHFVQKMKGRKAILLGGVPDKEEATIEGDSSTESKHKIARIVYDGAIQASEGVEFRLQFLDQCRSFPETEDLQDHIMESIEKDYSTSTPEAWIARAMYYKNSGDSEEKGFLKKDVNDGSDSDNNSSNDEGETARKKRRRSSSGDKKEISDGDPALNIIRQACTTLKSSDMFYQSIMFLQSYLGELSDTEKFNKCRSCINELFKLASKEHDYFRSAELVLEHAKILQQMDKSQDAIRALEKFATTGSSHKTAVPARVWIQWAALTWDSSSPGQSISILQKALSTYPMHDANYLVVLLQLFGCFLSENQQSNEEKDRQLDKLFQQIIILAPAAFLNEGKKDDADMDIVAPFIACDIPTAFLKYLLYTRDHKSIKHVRKVYESVLFQSSLTESLPINPIYSETLKEMFDASIAAEQKHFNITNNDSTKKSAQEEYRKRAKFLFMTAIKVFNERDAKVAAEYKRRRNDEVIHGTKLSPRDSKFESSIEGTNYISFDTDSPTFDPDECLRVFQRFQVVHLKNTAKSVVNQRKQKILTWKDIGEVFKDLNAQDRDSWCIESEKASSPKEFLDPASKRDERAYCSFLIQRDEDSYSNVLGRLPVTHLPWEEKSEWSYEPAIWVFFGRNGIGNRNLPGRPDHTDSVNHDGTWHFQLNGEKRWSLRPSEELLKHMDSIRATDSIKMKYPLCIDCKKGDVIILNTRLWFHQTTIPPQREPSVSYARDFRLAKDPKVTTGSGMTNVDGLYAVGTIESDTIIFRENEMPDCELHTSKDPNCEVVELEDGTNAVVSIRNIAPGEFFCVPEDSSDNSDDEILQDQEDAV